MPGQYNKVERDRAAQMDLLTYFRNFVPHDLVKQYGERYSSKTYSSLVISNGMWIRNAEGDTQKGRSALDFLIKVEGMHIADAINLLNGKPVEYSHPAPAQPKAAPRPFRLPARNKLDNRVIAYLRGREIAFPVIQDCLTLGILYEDKDYHNCIFVGFDEAGTARFACKRGTMGADYKQDVSGSSKDYGFCVPALDGQAANTVYVSEGPINALSDATIRYYENPDSWRNHHYLSLAGTSTRALWKFLENHPQVTRIALGTDNDKAGRLLAEKIIAELSERGGEYTILDNFAPARYNDKNDYLRGIPMKNKGARTMEPVR